MSEPDDTVQELSDEELMLRYGRDGDLEAFEVLVCRHERSLYNFILRTLGNEASAREILQETFVAVVRNAEGWEPDATFKTWVYTIARNKCIDVMRKKRPKLTLDRPIDNESEGTTIKDRLEDEDAVESDAALEKLKFQEALSQALDTLPEAQREVFMLREVSGMTYKEIAGVQDVSVGTAKSRMRLALECLRGHLTEFEEATFKG